MLADKGRRRKAYSYITDEPPIPPGPLSTTSPYFAFTFLRTAPKYRPTVIRMLDTGLETNPLAFEEPGAPLGQSAEKAGSTGGGNSDPLPSSRNEDPADTAPKSKFAELCKLSFELNEWAQVYERCPRRNVQGPKTRLRRHSDRREALTRIGHSPPSAQPSTRCQTSLRGWQNIGKPDLRAQCRRLNHGLVF